MRDYIQKLDNEGCQYCIICKTKKEQKVLERILNKSIHIIKPWDMMGWVKLIRSEDIIVIHHFRKTMWKRIIWFWTQIAAISVYAPPVTTYFCCKKLTESLLF